MRRDLGEQYIDTALGVLRMPQVIDALGEEAQSMATILETSFVAPRKGSDVVVPTEQQDTDNLAIYPVLPTELRLPIRRGVDWLLPSDRERFIDSDPLSYTIQRERDFQLRPEGLLAAIRARRAAPDDSHLARHSVQILTYQKPDGAGDVARGRGLVSVDVRAFSKLSRTAIAACMAHEVQHAIHDTLMFQVPGRTSFEMAMVYGNRRLLTYNERYAYDIQYQLMRVLNPDGPSVEQLTQNIAGLDLNQTVSELANSIEKYRKRDPYGDDHLQAVAAGAVVISWMFGSPEAMSTDNEIAAYERLGYVRPHDPKAGD